MICVSNLQFSYPESRFVMEVDDLCIESGEAVAVIGPSGAGKTTLLNLIAGVIVPHSGQVATNEAILSTMPDARRREFRIRHIGLIFQEFELLEYLNVRDNILLPYRMSHTLRLEKNVIARLEILAEQTGIADKLKRPIRHLSQGERQRVAFCRAVLPDPPLLLADEPTGNLDAENTDRLLDILFTHVQRVGMTLVAATHERDSLKRFDRIIDCAKFRKTGTDA